MRRLFVPALVATALAVGCAAHRHVSTQGTLADLQKVRPDVKDVKVDQGLDQAMQGYRKFLEETPETKMTPEAMRRLADLEIEKRFGIHTGDGKPREMAAPEAPQGTGKDRAETPPPIAALASTGPRESDRDFEKRTTAPIGIWAGTDARIPPAGTDAVVPGTGAAPVGGDAKGPLEAIALYRKLLTDYPDYAHSDQVLYQMARAYDELGRTEEAMETMERLIRANPHSVHYDEVQFRRGEYFFTRRKYRAAEDAYTAVIHLGTGSSYYELALYKLGWTFYKQQLYEEALQQYVALLDYKVSIGYDFDQTHEEEDERRVADTFRVISLSFSNLGGPDAVRKYFASAGSRSYESRVYSNLGDYYLAKLRYDDAAKTFKAFVALHPFDRAAPRFSMRVVETFTKGGFSKLVLEAKREFASKYGLQSEYWQHFKPEESPEVLAYLKTNLKDLASYYHSQYQSEQKEDAKLADYREARRWYGKYLESFPKDAESPAINYQLADLLLENKDFGEAAKQYERTAYGYPPHPKSAAAGYAAVYAYREELKAASPEQQEAIKHDTVASSIRFVDAFPKHEEAAAVLGAAADDLYEMKDYPKAVATAQRLIDNYPDTSKTLQRSAWIVVGHGSFELAQYPQAEHAYGQVLALTPEGDESRPGFVDNLAASIYKQGELANKAKDYRAAADQFLRIRDVAPTSTIRPTAEYDAGAALIRLQDWAKAAEVLEAFRQNYPDNKLVPEATREIAHAYRESGQLSRAAEEYERLASQSDDPKLRSESLLAAGDLFEQSKAPDRALAAYQQYVSEFPHPVEGALEARFKIAEIYKAENDDSRYRQELAEIVRIDGEAGSERTARTRTLAGKSALVLAERLFDEFVAVKLQQPFEVSLQEKKQRMDTTIEAMNGLVAYEVADVTAAATYYMAETYLDFNRALTGSERPAGLQPSELEEYEKDLQNEAAPFEEKAINLHEKNLELLQKGVFDEWTKKSLGRLAELVPERYARQEISSDFLESLDSYVYRSPASQASEPTTGGTDATSGEKGDQTAQPVPTSVNDSKVEEDDASSD